MSEKKRGRPPGSEGSTRRFNRGLAAYARERIPPELYVDWQLAILQGFDAVLIKDERCVNTGGYRIEHREGGVIPSIDQKDRAMTNLRQAIWGLPAQAQQIDVQIKQQAMIGVVALDAATSKSLGVGDRAELIATVERLLAAGGPVTVRDDESASDADDAEFTEPEGDQEPSE